MTRLIWRLVALWQSVRDAQIDPSRPMLVEQMRALWKR